MSHGAPPRVDGRRRGGAGEEVRTTPAADGAAEQLHRRTNPGTDDGAMPAKVSENIRATVTAGLAKLVELVNQYAAAM